MLVSAKRLNGYHLKARDGEIGSEKDFYLDDNYWTIRYFVSDTGRWLSERKVLITATREQVKASPEYVEGQMPTRDDESLLYRRYDRPSYWADTPAAARHGR